jgi:hypothetical protein
MATDNGEDSERRDQHPHDEEEGSEPGPKENADDRTLADAGLPGSGDLQADEGERVGSEESEQESEEDEG